MRVDTRERKKAEQSRAREAMNARKNEPLRDD